jgi:hypothetical protein
MARVGQTVFYGSQIARNGLIDRVGSEQGAYLVHDVLVYPKQRRFQSSTHRQPAQWSNVYRRCYTHPQ